MSTRDDIQIQNDEMFEDEILDMELNEQEEALETEEVEEAEEAEETEESELNIATLKELLGSIQLNGEWFRRNLLFFVVLTGCLLAFVTNRYQAQQEMIEEAELKHELDEMRYIWLTRFSELTTAQRQSQIEERLKQLGDSTLMLSKEAPFIIKADK